MTLQNNANYHIMTLNENDPTNSEQFFSFPETAGGKTVSSAIFAGTLLTIFVTRK